MVHASQTYYETWELGPVTIRALRSLTREQAEVVSEAVTRLDIGCTTECYDDCDGYLSIMVAPETEVQPTYVISGTIEQIELARLHDDKLERLGTFNTVQQAVSMLDALLRA